MRSARAPPAFRGLGPSVGHRSHCGAQKAQQEQQEIHKLHKWLPFCPWALVDTVSPPPLTHQHDSRLTPPPLPLAEGLPRCIWTHPQRCASRPFVLAHAAILQVPGALVLLTCVDCCGFGAGQLRAGFGDQFLARPAPQFGQARGGLVALCALLVSGAVSATTAGRQNRKKRRLAAALMGSLRPRAYTSAEPA